MALNEASISIKVRQRLGMPASSRPMIMTTIASGLARMSHKVVNDYTKRHLLLTDKTAVTALVTNLNNEYYADLATIITANGVMLDYLRYGTVYFTYEAFTFAAAGTGTSIGITAHGYPTGLKVRWTTTGALPAAILANTTYYVISVDANTIQMATSYANALAGTAITISTTGSGNHTITPWEQQIVQWNSRAFGNVAKSLPYNYVYGWLDKNKLITTVPRGVFSFSVPFTPTLTTCPATLEEDLVDAIVEIMGGNDAGQAPETA